MAKWTPEQRAERARKISETKRARGAQGNVTNLAKGWDPEVRAKAIASAVETNTGSQHTEEHKAAIAASLKQAYAEGRRRRGHSEETKRKIGETKRRRNAEK